MILEINQVLVWCPTLCPHGHQQTIYIYHYQQEQTTQGFHMHTSAMYLITVSFLSIFVYCNSQ